MYDKDILECYEETKDRYFAYLKKIKAIEKAIGRSNLIIRVYEKNQFEGTRNDVISDFLHVLGKMYSPLLQGNDWEYPERQNVKLSDYALSYALEYNREFNKYSRNKSLQPEIQMSNRELSRLTDDGGRGRYLNLIQRKNLLDSYANENETIAREYLNREDGKLFYNDCVEYTLWKKQEFTELDRKIISIMAKQAAEYSNRILLLREKNNKRGVIRELKRKYIKHKDIMRRRLWTIFPI